MGRRKLKSHMVRGLTSTAWVAGLSTAGGCSQETTFYEAERKESRRTPVAGAPEKDMGYTSGTSAAAGESDSYGRVSASRNDDALVSPAQAKPALAMQEPLARQRTFELTSGLVTHDIKLDRVEEPSRWTFTQPAREMGVDERTQGAARKSVTQDFAQDELGLLDVLVVVDDSGSMKEEQVGLSTRLGALMGSVAKSNWQIGVITTDPARPSLRALNVVSFKEESRPAPGARISVTYDRAASASWFADMTLSRAPDVATLEVSVGGNSLASTESTYDPATRALRFKAPPVEASRVVVRYKVGALGARFPLALKGAIDGRYVLARDGAPVKQGWRVEGEAIVFDTAPSEGALFELTGRLDGGALLAYPSRSREPVSSSCSTQRELAFPRVGRRVRYS